MTPKHLPLLARILRRSATAGYYLLIESEDRERMFWRFPEPRHRKDSN